MDNLRIHASNDEREEESNGTLKIQSFGRVTKIIPRFFDKAKFKLSYSFLLKKKKLFCVFLHYFCLFLLASNFESEATGMQAIWSR